MSAPPTKAGEPITDRRQLIEYLASGCKPAEQFRIGTEHEKIVFQLSDYRPAPYEGTSGINALLVAMERYGWQPLFEDGRLLALSRDGGAITLEPAGQLELSGAPLSNIHQTCAEVNGHLNEARAVCAELGLGMLGLGFEPKWRREDMPLMPKARSEIMRRYMPKVGSLGLDMMHRTCTVQVNLDFLSEADMVRKMRIGMALQPVATALFAASPFTEGKPNGYQSYRSHIWTDTDNDRSGILRFVFEPGFGFERYVDYILDVPMYFVYRDGKFIDAAGQSFRDFMAGKLPALPGEIPHIGDWADHLTTAFPEVRLKRYIEMRGADCGAWQRICALPALWVGLLYDSAALDEAEALIRDWSAEEVLALRNEVPRNALRTMFRGASLASIAREVVAISARGLARRAIADRCGDDESHFLKPLAAIAESGRTISDELLERYDGPWHGDIDRIYLEESF